MVETATKHRGVIRGGVIVPEAGAAYPDGTRVEYRVLPAEFTPDERAEFERWDQLSAESFQMILDLEAKERDERR